jgi:hypothetical protein
MQSVRCDSCCYSVKTDFVNGDYDSRSYLWDLLGIEKPIFDYERIPYDALLIPGYLNSFSGLNKNKNKQCGSNKGEKVKRVNKFETLGDKKTSIVSIIDDTKATAG